MDLRDEEVMFFSRGYRCRNSGQRCKGKLERESLRDMNL